MWSDYRTRNYVINTFVEICDRLDVQGYLETKKDGMEYLTIYGPDGGYRSCQLDLEVFQGVAYGKDDQMAKWEMKKWLIDPFTYASFHSTSLLDLTPKDREFFESIEMPMFDMATAY